MNTDRPQSESDGLQNGLDGPLSDYNDSQPRTAREKLVLADELVVHGLLLDLSLDDSEKDEQRISNALEAIAQCKPQSKRVSRLKVAATLAALAASVLVVASILQPSKLSASEALDRLINSVSQSVDRTYRLSVVKKYNSDEQARQKVSGKRQALIEELDGATLYVGGVDRYVFIRSLADGRKRISGCDGIQSWSFREDSPVHVTHGVKAYRRGLPGRQQGFGFTDLFAQLTELRDKYDVVLQPISNDQSCLIGERKRKVFKGPERIEFYFDTDDGTIHSMLLDGLPRGPESPKKVRFELIAQQSVDESFYSHESHHEVDRHVKFEEPRK